MLNMNQIFDNHFCKMFCNNTLKQQITVTVFGLVFVRVSVSPCVRCVRSTGSRKRSPYISLVSQKITLYFPGLVEEHSIFPWPRRRSLYISLVSQKITLYFPGRVEDHCIFTISINNIRDVDCVAFKSVVCKQRRPVYFIFSKRVATHTCVPPGVLRHR